MKPASIRAAREADLPAIRDIYNYYVRETAITSDLEEVSAENRAAWFAQFEATGRYRLLVAHKDGELAGFAYSSRYRAKAAYDTSVETTIYTTDGMARNGIGRDLYNELFRLLRNEDIHRALAIISEPNAASDSFHAVFGFRKIGVLSDVGRKFGRYHTTGYWEKVME